MTHGIAVCGRRFKLFRKFVASGKREKRTNERTNPSSPHHHMCHRFVCVKCWRSTYVIGCQDKIPPHNTSHTPHNNPAAGSDAAHTSTRRWRVSPSRSGATAAAGASIQLDPTTFSLALALALALTRPFAQREDASRIRRQRRRLVLFNLLAQTFPSFV